MRPALSVATDGNAKMANTHKCNELLRVRGNWGIGTVAGSEIAYVDASMNIGESECKVQDQSGNVFSLCTR